MMFNSNYMFSNWYFVLLLLIIVAVIVANDAGKRGYNGMLWAFVVLFIPMMGILFYLIFISFNPSYTTTYNRPQTTPRRTQYTQAYQPPTQEETIGEQFCVSCGSGNVITAEFCNSCGSEIPKLK